MLQSWPVSTRNMTSCTSQSLSTAAGCRSGNIRCRGAGSGVKSSCAHAPRLSSVHSSHQSKQLRRNWWQGCRRAQAMFCRASAGGAEAGGSGDQDAEQPQPSSPGDQVPAGGSSGENIPSLPLLGADTDWREFRARLVAGHSASAQDAAGSDEGAVWAHSIPHVEKGCVLISHPLMFANTQTYFSQAVIFITAHDETHSVGLILNRPTQFNIGGLSGAEQLLPEFADCPLYLGGDVGGNTLHLLHSQGSLPDTREVVGGVYIGGFSAAKMAVRQERLQARQFKWFTRYSGWGPGQLAAECRKGVWFTAAASKALILKQSGVDGAELWHEVLQLMGGEWAELSSAMQETYRPDIMEFTPEQQGEQPPEDTAGSKAD